MAIPDFQTTMLPLLKFAADGKEHTLREAIDALTAEFHLTEEERKQMLESGMQVFDNRVAWAKSYMKKAGLLSFPGRSRFKITERGLKLLEEQPGKIDIKLLKRYPEFIEFRQKKEDEEETIDVGQERTPREQIESGYKKIRSDLQIELLDTIKTCSPEFFENLVVDLLVRMGYGGSRIDAGQAIGRSGDEGIDGIIKEDRLGLDIVYVQAKRWQSGVGRPEIQKFAGALAGKRARKGIFITTSTFSADAREYVSNIEAKIVLIDGKQLTDFMIDNNVGVTTEAAYEIKKIDSDYFTVDE